MPAQSMREQLEDAFNEDQQEEGTEEETGGPAEDTEEPLGDTPGEEDSAGEADDKEGDGDTGEQPPPDTGTGDGGKKAAADKVGSAKEQDTAESTVKGKAPASWKPDAREHWGKVPKEAQREIARREKHMDNMLRESADARKHHADFNQLMYPYEPLIASQNSTPFQAVQNLLQTAAGLSLGSATQKAQIIANVMNEYGVDVSELDTILVGSGQGGQAGQPAADPNLQSMLQQELAPIRGFMNDLNSQRQNYEAGQQQTMEQDIDSFARNPKNEFFEDVRENMADLMEMAANRGEAMTIDQAYDKACRMDTGIWDIQSKRNAANSAGANKKSMAKKRHAASSIQGNSVGDQTGLGATTIRGALTDAWDDSL